VFNGFGFKNIRNQIRNIPYNNRSNPWTERYCLDEQYDINFYGNPYDNYSAYCNDSVVTRQAIDDAIRLNKTCLLNSGKKGEHPYHQHVNPFQIIWYDQGDTLAKDVLARHCEWRDTIPASPDLHIQFVPRVFTGDVIVHCHLIQHEDHGMMGFYDITNDVEYCKGKLPATPTVSPTRALGSDGSDGPDFKDTLWIVNGVLVGLVIIMVLCTLIMCCYFRARIKGRHSFSNDSSTDSNPPAVSPSDQGVELIIQRVHVNEKGEDC